jgi:hypothetical protein
MQKIERTYLQLCNTPLDINEHLPTLCKYAAKCETIIETGVRGCVSSWALVYGLLNNRKPTKKILLNDITPCNIHKLLDATQNLDIDVRYIWKNNLQLNIEGNVDMVFIDTWHVYAQLKRELEKFSKITNKYIIMHDTTVDEVYGETIRMGGDATRQSIESGFPVEEINRGLGPAISEFLLENKDWVLLEKYTNNNGLTILERIK